MEGREQTTIPDSRKFVQRKLDVLRNSTPSTPELKAHFNTLLNAIDKGVQNKRYTFEQLGTSEEEIEKLKTRLSS